MVDVVERLWEIHDEAEYSKIRVPDGSAPRPPSYLRQLDRAIQSLTGLRKGINRGQGTFSIEGAAGYARLSHRHVVEIIPKFLNPNDPGWRDDFVFACSVAHPRGLQLSADLPWSSGENRLPDLLASSLSKAVEAALPRPIVEYEFATWKAPEASGELDPVDMAMPSADGFRQTGLRRTSSNPEIGLIKKALDQTSSEAKNPMIRMRARRLAHHVDLWEWQQRRPPRRAMAARHARWQPAYGLARAILSSKGTSYRGLTGKGALGFMVPTASMWERLLWKALCQGYGSDVAWHQTSILGQVNHAAGSTSAAETTPDYTIHTNERKFLADAKYKRIEKGATITRSDLYEALAFLKAAQQDLLILLYPSASHGLPPGSTSTVATFESSGGHVVAATVNAVGIAKEGLRSFGIVLRQGLDSISQAHDEI